MQDVFVVGCLAAGSTVNLGVAHGRGIAKQMLPHIGGGDQVGLSTAFMQVQAVQDVGLGRSGPVRFEPDVVVGKNRTCNGRVIFDLSPQVLFFQTPDNFEVSLGRVYGGRLL